MLELPTDRTFLELELYRLEKKFTRRKHRSTFAGEIEYVDGEYRYHQSHRI